MVCVNNTVMSCFITFPTFKLLRETPPDGDKFAWMVEVSSICIHIHAIGVWILVSLSSYDEYIMKLQPSALKALSFHLNLFIISPTAHPEHRRKLEHLEK